ncbi:hypothetical protein PAEPH01_1411, partial [Pancytospora epiphaga]
ERLYLPRDEMGRGLHNIEMRSEQMLLQFSTYLQANAPGSTRCAAIYRVEAECHSHLCNIKEYLRVRYTMAEEVITKSLSAAQIAQLYSDIIIAIRSCTMFVRMSKHQS